MTALANIPTGLSGYEQAIQGGTAGAVNALDAGQAQGVQSILNSYRGARDQDIGFTREGMGAVDNGFNAAANAVSGFGGAGNAQQVMAMLSGANGADAQAEAYGNYQSSPGQRYLQERGERAVLRNSAATGGTQGGNVLMELQRHGIGQAAQDFDNSFNRLGAVAQQDHMNEDRRLQAASMLSGVRQNQGQLKGNMLSTLGGRQAGIRLNAGTTLANYQNQAGRDVAGVLSGAGQAIGNARFDTGRDIANSIAQTTNQMAANQSGDVFAQMMGGDTQALSNLIIAAQNGDAQSSEALASIIANMAVGAGNSVAGMKGIPGTQHNQGMLSGLGSLAGGIGGLLGAF